VFLHRLCALKYADLDAHADTPEVKARRNEVAAFEARMTELSKTACYTMRQLAVNGGDLMEAGLPAGPAGRGCSPAPPAARRYGGPRAERKSRTVGVCVELKRKG